MNRNDFTGFITGSRMAGISDISGVREMTMLFPWFHSAHLVLLRSLKESSDVKFETQLHQSAMFVANREVLYNYLYFSSPVIKEEEPLQTIPVKSEEIDNVAADETETSVVKTEPEAVAEIDSEPEVSQPAAEIIKEVVTRSREELIAEIEARLKDLAGESAVGTPVETIETTEAPMPDKVTIPPVEEVLSSEEEISVLENDNIALDYESVSTGDESKYVLELDMASVIAEISSGESEAESENIKEDLLELEDDDRYSEVEPEYMIQIQDSVTGSGEEKDQLSQTDLIERFIQTSPKLERMTPGNEPPVKDLSESSTEIKGAFITETLARIYISQGYYSKAINIYEKLTLQYPEKSAYFASRIDKIKDLIK